MRKDRGEFISNTNLCSRDASGEVGDDPMLDLVAGWFREFRVCVASLMDAEGDLDAVNKVHGRLSDLERRICVVIDERDRNRICLEGKAHWFVKRLRLLRSQCASPSQSDLGCSVNTLERLYKERTVKKRDGVDQQVCLDPRSLRAIESIRVLPQENRPHHVTLRRMKISDTNACQLWSRATGPIEIKQVQSVDLSQNQLSSSMVLLNLVRMFPDLQFLDIRGNRFAETSDVIDIAKYVSDRPNFTGIDIRGNLINIPILSACLWFHVNRSPPDSTESFLRALGKIAITNNKTCKDLIP